MDLEFHDAPPPTKAESRFAPFLAALKANPGKWAKYPERINPQYGAAWRAIGFLVVSRNNEKNKGDIWASWPADEARS